MNVKYTIDYGFGIAYLDTPYDPTERFCTLASTCFGIRKSIACCLIIDSEDVPCKDFERLEFNGDVYVWREDGARKAVQPELMADDDWDLTFRDECRYKPKEEAK